MVSSEEAPKVCGDEKQASDTREALTSSACKIVDQATRSFEAALKRAFEHAAQAVKEKPKRRSLSPQIFVRNAKNALDARLVSHANLNVGLFEKAGVVVDAIALDKHRLNCLEGR